MNLYASASVIGVVNPYRPAQMLFSTGYSTAADGTRSPSYGTPVAITAQVQELTQADLRQIEGLNLQGVRKAIYVPTNISGAVRKSVHGGDLIVADGSTWLVGAVLENWLGEWTKVAAVQQLD